MSQLMKLPNLIKPKLNNEKRQTGKSTLIKCLVKRYTKQSISDIKGPVTVVVGKKKRITFIECENDMNAMIDTAKIADLVLLTVDASFGFEMETFEFLNIAQTHGFPRIMGVLTHLDSPKFLAKNNGLKKLRAVKKKLKHRFWTEIYNGAKLFYLSGLLHGSKYPKQEVLNLSRFIAQAKFRPLIYRNSHAYALCDRFEDLTPEDEVHRTHGKCDRTVSLYGYVRGTRMRQSMNVHIAGVGDFVVDDLQLLPDPCPSPSQNLETKKRIDDKQVMLHAPMSEVGGILYDKDAVYISVPGFVSKQEDFANVNGDEIGAAPEFKPLSDDKRTQGEKLVVSLQGSEQTLAEQLNVSKLRLFSSSRNSMDRQSLQQTQVLQTSPLSSDDADGVSSFGPMESVEKDDNGRIRRRAVFGDLEEEIDAEDFEESDQEAEVSEDLIGQGVLDSGDLEELKEEEDVQFADSDSDMGDDMVFDESAQYEEDLSEFESDQEVEVSTTWKQNLASKARDKYLNASVTNLMDLVYGNESKPLQTGFVNMEASQVDTVWDDSLLDSIKDRFVVDESANELRHVNEVEGANEVFDDFEDLEADIPTDNNDEVSQYDELTQKKQLLKQQFDAEYDNQKDDDDVPKSTYYDRVKESMAEQTKKNIEEFQKDDDQLRARVEGFLPGNYVRILVKGIPAEFIDNFNPRYPLLVGGLLPGEEKMGYIQVRIKKHRWHKRILKCYDPLIISLGWRRFQTMPIYSLSDGTRNKLLKYTPEHMHCMATFYGPLSAPNTGLCAVQSVSSVSSEFRISATGVVLETDSNFQIVKKLKLTGYPFLIKKNSAFIKDMFTSPLEVAKFEGASIKTVSGIRGQIKKAVRVNPAGSFRATFEDRILMSDIVFLRSWYPVRPAQYFNPVTNMLLKEELKWQGMKLVRDLRRERQIDAPRNMDSEYTTIKDRPEVRKFNTLKIPRAIKKELPFMARPKDDKRRSSNKSTYQQRRAVILEPKEKAIYSLLQQINTIKNEKSAKLKVKQQEKRAVHLKKLSQNQDMDQFMDKKRKKVAMRKLGQADKKRSIESSTNARSSNKKTRRH